MSEEFKKVESLVDQLKAYANTRLSQVKLSMAEKISKLAAMMIAMLMAALVFFLFLVLLSIAAAIAIGQWLDSYWLGFLIVAGISLWRNTGWWWLAAGAIFMFIAAGAGMGDMFYIGNLGEVALGFANLYTAKKFLS